MSSSPHVHSRCISSGGAGSPLRGGGAERAISMIDGGAAGVTVRDGGRAPFGLSGLIFVNSMTVVSPGLRARGSARTMKPRPQFEQVMFLPTKRLSSPIFEPHSHVTFAQAVVPSVSCFTFSGRYTGVYCRCGTKRRVVGSTSMLTTKSASHEAHAVGLPIQRGSRMIRFPHRQWTATGAAGLLLEDSGFTIRIITWIGGREPTG